jgi:hypothetical protein
MFLSIIYPLPHLQLKNVVIVKISIFFFSKLMIYDLKTAAATRGEILKLKQYV